MAVFGPRQSLLSLPVDLSNAQMGYARLQLLLGYVVPEMLDEDWSSEEDLRAAESEEAADGNTDTREKSPLHVPFRPYGEASVRGTLFRCL